jgi:hypothetical protein
MKVVLIAFLISVVSISNAQISSYTEVVYLKNGGIIKGVIIEQVPNEKLKIETKDGNVFVYTFSEIEKITKELNAGRIESNNSKSNIIKQQEVGYKSKGYFNATELIVGIGSGEVKRIGYPYNDVKNNSGFYGIRTSHGFQVSSNFAFGIGTGIILGDYDDYFPIYVDLRFPFGKNKIRTSLNLIGGGMLGYSSRYFINPSIGMKIYLNNSSSFNLNLGTYTRPISVYQGVPVAYSWPASYSLTDYLFTNFLLSLGFSF